MNIDHNENLQKLNSMMNELYEDINVEDNKTHQNYDGNINKLIKCKHEIIFKIVANVLEENDKEELVQSKEICSKTYHIPVPEDADYHEYMKAFFSFLEQALASSTEQTYRENENTKHD